MYWKQKVLGKSAERTDKYAEAAIIKKVTSGVEGI
jgi:hypothetical protein